MHTYAFEYFVTHECTHTRTLLLKVLLACLCSSRVSLHVFATTHTHTDTHTYTQTLTQTLTHTHTHSHTYTYINIHTHTQLLQGDSNLQYFCLCEPAGPMPALS